MAAQWKRYLDLFFVVTYSVIMVTVAMVLVAVDLWGVAFAQLVAIGLLIRYYREARRARP